MAIQPSQSREKYRFSPVLNLSISLTVMVVIREYPHLPAISIRDPGEYLTGGGQEQACWIAEKT